MMALRADAAMRGRTGRATALTVVNFVVFEAAWFACVIGAAHQRVPAGIVAVAAAVALQLAIGGDARRDLKLVGAALATGLVWDSAMVQAGWIAYASPGPWPLVAPAWILALWALFATALPVSLRWLQRRPVAAALLGAIGGPLSYLGAERLGACQLLERTPAITALAVGWAVITPVLVALTHRFETNGGAGDV
jgi:hypothetical protein